MKKRKSDFDLRLSVETNSSTGDVLAVYFQVRKGKSARVLEMEAGAVFCDYNKDGKLLGVEMLSPCDIKVLDKIARQEPFSTRAQTKKFFRNTVPRQMVAANC